MPTDHHVHDLGTFGCVHDSHNQYDLSLDTAEYSTGFVTKPRMVSKNINSENLKQSEIRRNENAEDEHRQILKIRLIWFWES